MRYFQVTTQTRFSGDCNYRSLAVLAESPEAAVEKVKAATPGRCFIAIYPKYPLPEGDAERFFPASRTIN